MHMQLPSNREKVEGSGKTTEARKWGIGDRGEENPD